MRRWFPLMLFVHIKPCWPCQRFSETKTWGIWELASPWDLTSSKILGLLVLMLDNSYFKFDGEHYHQICGCAKGQYCDRGTCDGRDRARSFGSITYQCSLVAPICRRLQFLPQLETRRTDFPWPFELDKSKVSRFLTQTTRCWQLGR